MSHTLFEWNRHQTNFNLCFNGSFPHLPLESFLPPEKFSSYFWRFLLGVFIIIPKFYQLLPKGAIHFLYFHFPHLQFWPPSEDADQCRGVCCLQAIWRWPRARVSASHRSLAHLWWAALMGMALIASGHYSFLPVISFSY